MRSDRFEFSGADGQRLAGRLDLPAGAPQAYAVFAHCFTCTKSSLAAVRIARALADKGYAVLRFDFTGLGESGGDFAGSSFSGSVRDLLAAARAVEQAAGVAPGLLVGHSLGGAAVLAAAGELPQVKAVATVAAPFDVQHVKRLFGDDLPRLLEQGEAEVRLGGRPFRMRRGFIDDLAAHDQAARIAGLRRALLVLHAPLDDTVSIDNAASIFQAARHPKSYVSLDAADHLLTRPADAAYAAEVIAAWASRYVGQRRPLRSAGEPGQVVIEETGAGDFQVEVQAGDASFLADEPPEVGGLGSGPTPYDLLGAGLGACTAMTLRLYARRKGWALRRVRVCVGHARSAMPDDARSDVFTRDIALDGDLEADQRAKLLAIADRCPVHRTLEQGARIATREVGAIGAALGVEPAGQHAADMQREVEEQA